MVNPLGLSLSRKNVDRLTDCLDMTVVVDWDVKQHSNKPDQTAPQGSGSTLCAILSAYLGHNSPW